jgi:hypothetical protein
MGTEQGGGDARRDTRHESKKAQGGQRFDEREYQRDESTKTETRERREKQ